MTKFNKLKELLLMINDLNKNDNLPDFDDLYYMKNPKISNIQFKIYILTMKIMDDEISDAEFDIEIDKLIKEINETLTNDEKVYVKKDYKKMMNLRKEQI